MQYCFNTDARLASSVQDESAPIIIVAIPTLDRPEFLWNLLLDLKRLDHPCGTVVRFLVVDNSPNGDWEALVTEAERNTGLSLNYRHEPERGLAHVRNRCLDEAERLAGDYMFFLDDDQTPVPDALVAHFRAMRLHNAQVVFGAVRARYLTAVPRWMRRSRVHDGPAHDEGELLDYADTSNVFFDLFFSRKFGTRFDLGFNFTGGEDTLFFRTINASGGRIVYCADALVYENISAPRATLRWLIKRWRWTGNNCARIDLAMNGSTRRAAHLFGGLARIAAGFTLAVLAVPAALAGHFEHFAEYVRITARGVGYVEAAFGHRNSIFKRSDH